MSLTKEQIQTLTESLKQSSADGSDNKNNMADMLKTLEEKLKGSKNEDFLKILKKLRGSSRKVIVPTYWEYVVFFGVLSIVILIFGKNFVKI